MKVLVTGGAGFLGSHLVSSLVNRSHDVVVLDNMHRGRLSHIEQVLWSNRVIFLPTDIRDYNAVSAAMEGVEIVYHLAAQSNVIGATQDPGYCFSTNVWGTFNVLKASAEAEVRRVVFASSREVYGEAYELPVSEMAPLAAKNPYGASKVAGEAYCRMWQEGAGLDCMILRFANIYGPGDRDRVIPLWLSQAWANQDLIIYGGAQVIDFLWVDYAVEAMLSAATCENEGPVNVGSGHGISIRDLSASLLWLTRSRSNVRYAPARRDEVVRFVADVRKMTKVLGVFPPKDPLEGLGVIAGDLGTRVEVRR